MLYCLTINYNIPAGYNSITLSRDKYEALYLIALCPSCSIYINGTNTGSYFTNAAARRFSGLEDIVYSDSSGYGMSIKNIADIYAPGMTIQNYIQAGYRYYNLFVLELYS